MFDKNYYCLVAGLREYSLDADTKGFNARAIIEEILEGVSARDARCVRLLYGYYDCENLVNFRKGRAAHNPLGNLSREEIEEQLYAVRFGRQDRCEAGLHPGIRDARSWSDE